MYNSASYKTETEYNNNTHYYTCITFKTKRPQIYAEAYAFWCT